MKFYDGATVYHADWGAIGTVHVFEDAADDEVQAEVQWHGTNVADELEPIASQLQVL